jgi:hypothetical protein
MVIWRKTSSSLGEQRRMLWILAQTEADSIRISRMLGSPQEFIQLHVYYYKTLQYWSRVYYTRYVGLKSGCGQAFPPPAKKIVKEIMCPKTRIRIPTNSNPYRDSGLQNERATGRILLTVTHILLGRTWNCGVKSSIMVCASCMSSLSPLRSPW